MQRRQVNSLFTLMTASSLAVFHGAVLAQSTGPLSNLEVSQGLKTALEQGARSAIGLLGRPDGFLSNDRVRIPLPGYLQDAAKLMRTFGQGARLDELVNAMNHAAEAAVPLAQDTLVSAVKSMSFQDARAILAGGDTSVTQFFADKTRQPLAQKFLPVVTKTTAQVNLAEKYNQVAGKAASMGLIKEDQVSIERYVTDKTLDGLYLMIGEEEKKIRQDPVGTGSAILQKVFGSLK
ncbi:MAG: DUF4197 domain-containing protein [Comamonadaceae bacterium]|nr:DUF4197 domain-containing protein [Comamonadaceae bacterium]